MLAEHYKLYFVPFLYYDFLFLFILSIEEVVTNYLLFFSALCLPCSIPRQGRIILMYKALVESKVYLGVSVDLQKSKSTSLIT